VAPLAFVANWLIYRIMLAPLVRRAKTRGALEVDCILATFGMSFIFVGIMLWVFGGDYFNYSYLSTRVTIVFDSFALNRVVAFLLATLLALALWLWLSFTRPGMTLRAVAVSPENARLVGIDVGRISALAFALGGAVTAVGGALISMFITLDASVGVIFTMKALIIVIMGGVGDIRGTVIAALILGIAETAVARLVDPGLTLAAAYVFFLLVLLFRPQGLFGRTTL
jgi:branched-chain amino acid transport system permease protein